MSTMNFNTTINRRIENTSVDVSDPRRYLVVLTGSANYTTVEVTLWGSDALSLWNVDPSTVIPAVVTLP